MVQQIARVDPSLAIVGMDACEVCEKNPAPTPDKPNLVVASFVVGAGLKTGNRRLVDWASDFLAQAPDKPLARAIPCEYRGRLLERRGSGRCMQCSYLCEQGVGGALGIIPARDCQTCDQYEPDADYADAQEAPKPVQATRWKWAVGVTTAPRATPTLQRSVASLGAAGWSLDGEVTIYAEPGSKEFYGVPTVWRSERRGAWPNWFEALQQIVDANPDADAYLMVQDDVTYCRGLRRYLERVLWPEDSNSLAWVSLYCSAKHDGEPGEVLHRWPAGRFMWGALAYVFPPAAARALLETNRVHRFTQNKIDTRVSKWARWSRRQPWYFRPSLVQHMRGKSSINHGQGWKMFADTFVGEEYDVDLHRPAAQLAGAL